MLKYVTIKFFDALSYFLARSTSSRLTMRVMCTLSFGDQPGYLYACANIFTRLCSRDDTTRRHVGRKREKERDGAPVIVRSGSKSPL